MNKIILAGLICLIAVGAHAGPGTDGAAFMNIGVGARPIAMGGAFGTVAGDVNALYYNPAGIARGRGLEILSTYGSWFEGIYFGYVGMVKSIPGLNSAVGVSIMYLDAGDIPGYDATGVQTEDYGAIDMGIGVTWALNLGNNLSVGLTGKQISQSVSMQNSWDYSASAVDFDLGVRVGLGPGFVLGCSVQNLLQSEIMLKDDGEGYPLARNLRAGIGYSPLDSMLIGADINMGLGSDSTMSMKLGAEYVFSKMVSFRTGYSMNTTDTFDFLSGICAGFGFSFEGVQVDYALVPYGDLGLTHRLSLTLKL